MDNDIIYRIVKYLMFLIIIIFALRIVPHNILNYTEILIISTIGIIGFTLLDIYMPCIIEKGERTQSRVTT